jgi:hypothetical protein
VLLPSSLCLKRKKRWQCVIVFFCGGVPAKKAMTTFSCGGVITKKAMVTYCHYLLYV